MWSVLQMIAKRPLVIVTVINLAEMGFSSKQLWIRAESNVTPGVYSSRALPNTTLSNRLLFCIDEET